MKSPATHQFMSADERRTRASGAKMFAILSVAILVSVILPSGQADESDQHGILDGWSGDECQGFLCGLQQTNTTAPEPPTLIAPASNHDLVDDQGDPAITPRPPVHWVFVWFLEDHEEPIVSNPYIPLGFVVNQAVGVDPNNPPDAENIVSSILLRAGASGNHLERQTDPSYWEDQFGEEVKGGITFNLDLDVKDRASAGEVVELLIADGDIKQIEEIEEPGRIIAHFKEQVKPDYGDSVSFRETPAVTGATYLLKLPGNQIHVIDPIYQAPAEVPSTSPLSSSSMEEQSLSGTSSTSTELARHDGIIVSDGEWEDEGTFITFSNIQASGDIQVTYKYCYQGQTNGKTAGIWTKFDGQSVNTNTFNTPYTGGSGTSQCSGGDSSTYATKSFEVTSASISNQIRFDYKNGDWKVRIAEIVVTAQDGSSSNSPPERATKPSGPASGIKGTTYSYSTSATDPNGDNVRFLFKWGDGTSTWTNWVSSGQSVSASKSWGSEGTYGVTARAYDDHGASGPRSFAKFVEISGPNDPPNTPNRPSGETNGATGVSYTYSTWARDPDSNQVQYQFDWGDGSRTWSNWASSSQPVSVSNQWGSAGTYNIKVRAKDSQGAYSDWSLTRTVNIRGSGHCSTNLDHAWISGNYDHGWENNVERDKWLRLGWGGWRYNWEYSSACDPNDTRTISSPAFGFGFTGHNYVSGKMVVDAGGNIRGDKATGSGPIHHAKLDGIQFFYLENQGENVKPFGGGVYGRSIETDKETCKDGPYGPLSTVVKAAITVASAKYWWLGFGTMVPDEYCKENWRSVTYDGGSGRGVKITGVGSRGSHQKASGWINVDYTNVNPGSEFRTVLRGTADHYVAAKGCKGCLYESDGGGYQYTVTPAIERAEER